MLDLLAFSDHDTYIISVYNIFTPLMGFKSETSGLQAGVLTTTLYTWATGCAFITIYYNIQGLLGKLNTIQSGSLRNKLGIIGYYRST